MIPLYDSNPERRFPVVNVALIVANFAVFLFYELPNQEAAIRQASFFPCDFTHACDLGLPWVVSWLTAMFMHVSWLHIMGNMLFLLIFGNNVEDAFGRLGYLAFYLGGGIAADVLQTAVTLVFGTADDARSANLGASGAIAAVLGAYIVLYPKARIFGLVGFIPFRLPAWFFLGFWFLFQLFAGRSALIRPDKTGGSGVAFFAHVGGFIFGVVLALVLTRTGRITSGIDNRAQGRLPAWHDHPPPTGDSTPSALAAPTTSTTAAPSTGPNVPQKSTNITCAHCGHVQAEPLSEATFECAACGAKLRRKTQSAKGSS
jgi:membrane associated rhomboid family serine protease